MSTSTVETTSKEPAGAVGCPLCAKYGIGDPCREPRFNKETEEALQEALEDSAGRAQMQRFDSVDELFDSILGPGWRLQYGSASDSAEDGSEPKGQPEN